MIFSDSSDDDDDELLELFLDLGLDLASLFSGLLLTFFAIFKTSTRGLAMFEENFRSGALGVLLCN